jgi:transcription-repair coupling factor (superfamily II helicase)
MLIAPTAILANQHFASLQNRLEPFGLNVARIDRFIGAKEKKHTLELAACNKIDVLVGTHAIFGVQMPKLGLAILDEEHKFGVKQKEKLKNLKADIHTLSMSATPIPRTLNLALSKIKGISELLTPPKKRLDAKTFVKAYSQGVFKEAALRELRRGGQIFYVHNRIASIDGARKNLQEILPNLKIEVLHSQIAPDETEKILLDFLHQKFDCLISTNIIESGIDMPNVNTIFIDDADMFGVADLHQLRGRIGRSDRQGYCYFFVQDFDTLTPEAKRRLSALESNSYLGSGAALAYHDLELRGGGNIIGEAQSGHIKQIGYSLYLRMLEDAINLLSGQISTNERSIELKLAISAYLSDTLIPYEKPRLELYRRLSSLESVHEISQIEEEIIDRFGALDDITKKFLKLIEIKILGIEANIKTISSFGVHITIVKNDDTKLELTAPFADDDDILHTTLKALRSWSKSRVISN